MSCKLPITEISAGRSVLVLCLCWNILTQGCNTECAAKHACVRLDGVADAVPAGSRQRQDDKVWLLLSMTSVIAFIVGMLLHRVRCAASFTEGHSYFSCPCISGITDIISFLQNEGGDGSQDA